MSLVFVFTRCPRYGAYILFQIFRIFVLFRKQSTQSKGFLTFLRLLTTLALQDHSKDGLSLYICCPLSLKALFIAKVSPRFLQAGKSTLVDENFDCFALSFRSATLLGLSKGRRPHLFLYFISYILSMCQYTTQSDKDEEVNYNKNMFTIILDI